VVVEDGVEVGLEDADVDDMTLEWAVDDEAGAFCGVWVLSFWDETTTLAGV